MFYIESRINGRWVRLSRKTYTAARAANLVPYMVDEITIADAGENYRYTSA